MPAWIEALMRVMFPETPDRITREVSQYAAPTAEALCWNRRKRRSLERSKGVILHLCCGSRRGEFQASASRHGMIVLDVDCKEDQQSPHRIIFAASCWSWQTQGSYVRFTVSDPQCPSQQGPRPTSNSWQVWRKSLGIARRGLE